MPRSSTTRRLIRLTRLFIASRYFWPAVALFSVILTLLTVLSRLNVYNVEYIGDLTTAMKDRKSVRFWQIALVLAGLCFVISGFSAVKQYVEERLALLLREGLTRHLLDRYLDHRAYLRLADQTEVDNPDQRITEDVKTLTGSSLSFAIILSNAVINCITFTHQLWKITPHLVWAAYTYALVGTTLTILIGKRLVALNIRQLKKEADFRFEMVRTREHAEAIAVQHDEVRLMPRLVTKLGAVIINWKAYILRNAFLTQFTQFYNLLYVGQQPIVSALVVAPLYFASDTMEFGVFVKSAASFVFVVNAISVIVTDFPRVTQITAAFSRLGELRTAMDDMTNTNGIEVWEAPNQVSAENLTLLDPSDGHVFVENLNFEVAAGKHLLVVGPAGSGKSELMRALAGIWRKGHGKIIRPPLDQIAFLPPQPYLTPGTLQNLLSPDRPGAPSADPMRVREALAVVGLMPVVDRVGGLNVERDWSMLSLGERQALMLAEMLVTPPRFAVLDEATSTLDARTRTDLYIRLARAGTTIITLSAHPVLPDFHKQRLDLTLSSDWRLTPIPA
ncbi:MAG: ABC transporter ATP-binding protein/permease [Gemmataceae bacterium]